MITIENIKVEGWEPAIRGMRNPMNSWEKSDSLFFEDYSDEEWDIMNVVDINGNRESVFANDETFSSPLHSYDVYIGPNDHELMTNLAKAGSEHSKYRRMIVVWCDITAPLYWWKEFDTYKVGTVVNSCSTMHKIHAKEFEIEDFSCEHLIDWEDIDFPKDLNISNLPVVVRRTDSSETDVYFSPKGTLRLIVEELNKCRDLYLETKDKKYWWQMIQLLPSSYNQRRTVMLNYENLAHIYQQRKDHKLDEWRDFCDVIKSLPYSEIITLEEDNGN